MSEIVPDMPDGAAETPGFGKVGAYAVAAGLGLALMAGVTLWASEGAHVFAESAFAALVACF